MYGLGREVTAARELGSYRLVELLGQGGMGEVWRAQHRMLARSAAIKLIRPSVSSAAPSGVSEEARRRFEREAQAIALLRSPHTVELFDFGVSADGAFYYVMELLDGLDADTLVRRFGPVPAERAIYLLRQVCHSLSEAESHGLVHRDIKPANIFVCRYGEDCDFVKVLDFGIAKIAGGRGHRDSVDAGERHPRHAGLHGPRAGARQVECRCTRRYLCHRLRRLLAADRGTRVHRGDSDGAPSSPRADASNAAVGSNGIADPGCPRRSSCCRAWQKTRPSGRSRRGSCRSASQPWRARTTWTEDRAREWWKTNQPGQGHEQNREPGWQTRQ